LAEGQNDLVRLWVLSKRLLHHPVDTELPRLQKKEEIKEKERVGLGRLYMCGVRSSSYKDQ